ncbi:methyltransferase [Amycolatopsis sp. WGS_07]|uniref:methyltransferase n=1 Tax=Amycolatopsis sp. WGS_07 TaxID=3076764 RepID=UPI003873B7E7
MSAERSAIPLFEEAMSFTYAAALRVVASVGVADRMGTGPRPVGELAKETGTDPGGLYRVLRLLAGRGVVREAGERQFALTELGEALRSDAEFPATAGILMFTDPMFWKVTHGVGAAVRDPRTSFDQIFGIGLDEYFAAHPATEALFYDGIEAVSDAENPVVARSYEFPPDAVVVDVGGRFGGFLLAVLRAHPGVRGVLFDRDDMLARHRLDEADVAGRWETVSGDFFVEVPAADVYVVKRNLHALGDEDSVRLLSTCRRSLRPEGRVLVIDAIIPEGNEPHLSKAMDFMMLANRVGGERTAAELAALFDAAGLRLNRVVPTASVMSIAEGVAR